MGSVLKDRPGRIFNFSRIDLDASHSFVLGRRRRPLIARRIVQGALLAAAGAFLLIQANQVAHLRSEIEVVAGLMLAGGLTSLAWGWAERQSRLVINRTGIDVRIGWSKFSVPWCRMDRWSVSESRRRLPQMAAVAVWGVGHADPWTIRDEYLDESDRRLVHRICRAYASEKEASWAHGPEIVRR
jgi:hypothetical protein